VADLQAQDVLRVVGGYGGTYARLLSLSTVGGLGGPSGGKEGVEGGNLRAICRMKK
jgi:hypothetical protein